MTQLLLDFSETLTDADGDTVVVDRLSDTERIISRLLKCSRKKSREILEKLSKDFDVYSNGWTTQLILAKDGRIIHNFEAHGETRLYGHKYNPVNEWDFRDFIAGKKNAVGKKKGGGKTSKTDKNHLHRNTAEKSKAIILCAFCRV